MDNSYLSLKNQLDNSDKLGPGLILARLVFERSKKVTWLKHVRGSVFYFSKHFCFSFFFFKKKTI